MTNKKLCSQTEKYFLSHQTLIFFMVTNISCFQDFASISFLDIYKCPKTIFGEWSWVKKLKVLYILTIFILKEHPFKMLICQSSSPWQSFG